MNLPDWARASLTELTAAAIKDGEGESIEFKVAITKDAEQISKEIAAFATSGGGSLFIGVEDNGHIRGLGNNRRRVTSP